MLRPGKQWLVVTIEVNTAAYFDMPDLWSDVVDYMCIPAGGQGGIEQEIYTNQRIEDDNR